MRSASGLLFLLSIWILLAMAKTAAGAGEQPHFSGEVGPFEEATGFVNFVFDHQQETVGLDVNFAEEEFAGSLGGPDEIASFVLWEACEDLPEEEPPSTSWCTGTEFSVDPAGVDPEESGLTLWAGVYRLKGRFAIVGCDGPHQGLMGCTLKALPESQEAPTPVPDSTATSPPGPSSGCS